jgi:hypothetical protein
LRCLPIILPVLFMASGAAAYLDPPPGTPGFGYGPNFAIVTDGSFIMNAGEMQVHINNAGLIGSAPGIGTSYSDAPSCQWPAGSGDEFLFFAGVWVGGLMLGEKTVSMGGLASEWMPRDELEATIYEAIDGEIIRPLGNTEAGGARAPMGEPDDDGDGLVDEETLDGHDDDEDGRIDEDFGQIGTQMMVTTTYDNTRLAEELFPDHTPMNLKLVQRAVAWENDESDDFVGFDYTITNVGVVAIERVYIGFFADSDVGPRAVEGYHEDDLAGSWRGMVRASDGTWVPVEVGFMYDGAETGPIDGYFGVVFLDHDVDPTGKRAPTRVGLRTFQSFSGNTAFLQGGDPTNDDEAYQLLSSEAEDWDGDSSRRRDYRFLVSAGPFSRLGPDETLTFQVAMVCGPGLGTGLSGPGLLTNCAEAWLSYQGIYVDELELVQNEDEGFINPGERGRETMLCKQDFADENAFDTFHPDYMDTSCLEPLWLIGKPGVTDADLFIYEGKECAMFNMDNCFECARQLGRPCSTQDFEPGGWTCGDSLAVDLTGCTGVGGLETQITWLVGMAPPPPGLRLWPADSRVHLFWDDRSEHVLDIRLQKIDFESYQIWRADNWDRPFGSSLDNGPEQTLWQLIAEYDVANSWVNESNSGGETIRDTLPLGPNTGLGPISYRPRVLDDPAYAELAVTMQDLVTADPYGNMTRRPLLRNPDGSEKPEYLSLLPWETELDVLDTFFAVTERPAGPGVPVPKRGTRYYEYIDRSIHNGFLYFYSVSATDHVLLPGLDDPATKLPRGPGLAGDPGSAFAYGTPGTEAQTIEEREHLGANIYVFPNPATRDALREYQQFDPTGGDPTGVRVTFTNLPQAHNQVKIYTVSGDLVQTLIHDGTAGVGHLSWNLMSRNAQEIVSGVYLYSVEADDRRFDNFVGQFTVVR